MPQNADCVHHAAEHRLASAANQLSAALDVRMEATFLFAPAHEERKAIRALASGCDAVIFDLEAAVPDSQKALGRLAVGRYLTSLRKPDDPSM